MSRFLILLLSFSAFFFSSPSSSSPSSFSSLLLLLLPFSLLPLPFTIPSPVLSSTLSSLAPLPYVSVLSYLIYPSSILPIPPYPLSPLLTLSLLIFPLLHTPNYTLFSSVLHPTIHTTPALIFYLPNPVPFSPVFRQYYYAFCMYTHKSTCLRKIADYAQQGIAEDVK